MEKWPAGFHYRRLFEGGAVRISRWRCQASPPRLGAERIQPCPVIVFSHSGNFQVQSSADIGLLDCTRVGFFNPRVPFQSAHPFGGGDSGSDLAIRPDILAEIFARHDPAAPGTPDRPFSAGSGPCDPQSFLLHRILLRKLALGGAEELEIDELEIEELSLLLADRLARASLGDSTRKAARRTTVREREEAEELRGILSSHPGRRHDLDSLARGLESTPFRLCRSFRAATGTTIHRYLTHVRMQRALGRLAEGSPDLTTLAFDLGFSSHSHFSSVFRRRLGITPESVRRHALGRGLAELRGRLALAPAAGH